MMFPVHCSKSHFVSDTRWCNRVLKAHKSRKKVHDSDHALISRQQNSRDSVQMCCPASTNSLIQKKKALLEVTPKRGVAFHNKMVVHCPCGILRACFGINVRLTTGASECPALRVYCCHGWQILTSFTQCRVFGFFFSFNDYSE